jgi:hypothetical protein
MRLWMQGWTDGARYVRDVLLWPSRAHGAAAWAVAAESYKYSSSNSDGYRAGYCAALVSAWGID